METGEHRVDSKLDEDFFSSIGSPCNNKKNKIRGTQIIWLMFTQIIWLMFLPQVGSHCENNFKSFAVVFEKLLSYMCSCKLQFL